MLQSKKKNLVELCPQCYKLIDSSANRLVHDTCGHTKCRICLLQEKTGCLLCITASKSSDCSIIYSSLGTELSCNDNTEQQPRKSVITSLAIQQAEQTDSERSISFPSVVKDTCHLIKQTLEKDILFPTDIVKKSTGNFYHLKRVFSQRFFNEDKNNKRHIACETEENWTVHGEGNNKTDKNDDISERKNPKIPSHIEIQYYCTIHKVLLQGKNSVFEDHMACVSDGNQISFHLYKCKFCDKSYKIIGKLNRHMKIHTKNSKFKCETCGKACTDNYALKTHQRSHNQLKPYLCSFCDKKFSGLQNFKRHQKKHRNEKNFVCNECGYGFLTNIELKRHSVVHTNIKSFVCSICSNRFAFKRTLMRHIAIHDKNLSRIKCPHCDSTFKRKDNLERHVKTSHLEVMFNSETGQKNSEEN